MMIMDSYFDKYILQGGMTMLALVPLSMYTLGIIIQRSLALRKKKVLDQEVIHKAMAVNSKGALAQYQSFLESHDSVLANIIYGYLEAAELGEPYLPSENMDPIDDEVDDLYHSLNPISTSYVVAPLLGVLGTTIGIMATFEQFASSGKRDMTLLVAAIEKSLVTTMWGLFIAVPAYYCYAILQRKIFNYERKVLPQTTKRVMKHLANYL
jgi:biopolymer transport protein ExbB